MEINKDNKTVYALAFGHFSIEIYAALLVPLYPIITKNLGINLAKISFIIAMGHLFASILQPYIGFIADKLKHRIFLIWGLVVTSIFIPLSSPVSNVLCTDALLPSPLPLVKICTVIDLI